MTPRQKMRCGADSWVTRPTANVPMEISTKCPAEQHRQFVKEMRHEMTSMCNNITSGKVKQLMRRIGMSTYIHSVYLLKLLAYEIF